jgi:dGTP triphosphohydrolase
MTLHEALNSRLVLQKEFEQALTEKVKQIQFHYDSPKLSDKQLKFLQKDEALCKVVEAFANKLIEQINFVIQENAQQQQMLSDMATELEKERENWINLCLEYNTLRFEKMQREGTLTFTFKEGATV